MDFEGVLGGMWTRDGLVSIVTELFAVCFVQNAERSDRILPTVES